MSDEVPGGELTDGVVGFYVSITAKDHGGILGNYIFFIQTKTLAQVTPVYNSPFQALYIPSKPFQTDLSNSQSSYLSQFHCNHRLYFQ